MIPNVPRTRTRQAQETRVYAEYLATMSTAETIDYHAISLVGPRNRVSKLEHPARGPVPQNFFLT